jgi:hypothetical protein
MHTVFLEPLTVGGDVWEEGTHNNHFSLCPLLPSGISALHAEKHCSVGSIDGKAKNSLSQPPWQRGIGHGTQT